MVLMCSLHHDNTGIRRQVRFGIRIDVEFPMMVSSCTSLLLDTPRTIGDSHEQRQPTMRLDSILK